MTTTRRRNPFAALLGRAAMAMLLACAATAATAQQWPTRTIRIIAPGAPGASPDVVARLMAQGLEQKLGVSVIVENRTGASGAIGAESVARAEPDGHTLLFTTQDTHVLLPLLNNQLPYDAANSFVPVGKYGDIYLLLAVHPSFPARTVRELVAHARQNPGAVRFASGGNGGINHLSVELLAQREKLNLQHIPYRGGSPAVAATMGGEVELVGGSPTLLAQAIGAGKLRGLAIAKDSRSAKVPDVPTMAEAGYPDYIVSAWFGLFAPRGTPDAVVERLNQAGLEVARSPDFQQRMANIGAEGEPLGRADFGRFLDAERTKWKSIIDNAKIKVE